MQTVGAGELIIPFSPLLDAEIFLPQFFKISFLYFYSVIPGTSNCFRLLAVAVDWHPAGADGCKSWYSVIFSIGHQKHIQIFSFYVSFCNSWADFPTMTCTSPSTARR